MSDNFRTDDTAEEVRKFDPYAHAVTVIGENHRLIHDGMFYTAHRYDNNVANLGTIDVLLSVPAAIFPHFQELRVSTTNGPDLLQMYEGVTTSDDGTAIPIFNKNRNSTRSPGTSVYHTPTVTDLGTLLAEHLIATPGKDAGVFTQDLGGEWMLKPSTKYLLRFTNNSGGVEQAELHAFFYELAYGF